jgi:hypothetical protein
MSAGHNLTKRRNAARFWLSFVIILAAILYWGVATLGGDGPDAIWDILIIAIVISAAFVFFGEERFSAALGETREFLETGSDAEGTNPEDE